MSRAFCSTWEPWLEFFRKREPLRPMLIIRVPLQKIIKKMGKKKGEAEMS
jgi:hypothetical protein